MYLGLGYSSLANVNEMERQGGAAIARERIKKVPPEAAGYVSTTEIPKYTPTSELARRQREEPVEEGVGITR